MGEALLIKAGGTGTSGNSSPGNLVTNIFTTSGTFIVPKAKNQSFSVRIFGGGGGGGGNCRSVATCGGGGGYMNNKILTLTQGASISVTIGKGGTGGYFSNNKAAAGSQSVASGNTGGTTSFGSYLSAIGGTGGTAGTRCYGGSGGSGGGGINYGGIGYQFGGGGGNYAYKVDSGSVAQEGTGGKWGGGGGCSYGDNPRGGCLFENSSNTRMVTGFSNLAGNGGNNSVSAENGVNTIGNNEVDTIIQGNGLKGSYEGRSINCGGGGFGGPGGGYCGGGGGYGAHGGNWYGGGGGYSGPGGDGIESGRIAAGGGGAYGAGGKGGNALTACTSGTHGGGGGGGIQNGYCGNGGDGICIIQYYT